MSGEYSAEPFSGKGVMECEHDERMEERRGFISVYKRWWRSRGWSRGGGGGGVYKCFVGEGGGKGGRLRLRLEERRGWRRV